MKCTITMRHQGSGKSDLGGGKWAVFTKNWDSEQYFTSSTDGRYFTFFHYKDRVYCHLSVAVAGFCTDSLESSVYETSESLMCPLSPSSSFKKKKLFQSHDDDLTRCCRVSEQHGEITSLNGSVIFAV